MSMGNWQHEERHHNPIFHEHSFQLQIQCKPGKFIIWQKHHKFEFNHRMDPSQINGLRIEGEVSVERIKFEGFHQNPTPNIYPPTNPSYSTPSGPGGYDPYRGPGIGIGGGTAPMPYPQQPGPQIGFGTGVNYPTAPQPNIGYGTTPMPNAGGYGAPTPNAGSYQPYPPSNPAPNAHPGDSNYPQMRPWGN